MTWKDPKKWQAMKDGTDCPFCSDIHLAENKHSFLVAELPSSYLRLPKNQYWKGWTIVALKKHATELFELSDEEIAQYWKDVSKATKAINTVFQPVKLNYAIYGNLCPHIHCHIFPLQLENDPHVPIKQNEKEVFLNKAEYEKMIADLIAALDQH